MLKKDLLVELDRARDRCGDLRAEVNAANSLIKEMRKEMDGMKNNKDCIAQTVTSINAIIATSCPESREWQRLSRDFHHLVMEGKEIPVKPKDALHDSLSYILDMLYSQPSIDLNLR